MSCWLPHNSHRCLLLLAELMRLSQAGGKDCKSVAACLLGLRNTPCTLLPENHVDSDNNALVILNLSTLICCAIAESPQRSKKKRILHAARRGASATPSLRKRSPQEASRAWHQDLRPAKARAKEHRACALSGRSPASCSAPAGLRAARALSAGTAVPGGRTGFQAAGGSAGGS